jgi:serine/threonine-protein kinase CHEK1
MTGYELVQQVGGGGFSMCVTSLLISMIRLTIFNRVFRAVNVEEHRVAACKLISLTEQTTEKERKIIDKEMKVHKALKHQNVLEFINAVAVEPRHKQQYIPGIYMLLEFAAGGDLFDKIGVSPVILLQGNNLG